MSKGGLEVGRFFVIGIVDAGVVGISYLRMIVKPEIIKFSCISLLA